MTESQLQTMILSYLKTQPQTFSIKTIKTNARGTPDIIISYRGFFIYIEVKSPQRPPRTTALQRFTMTSLESSGAHGFITNNYSHFITTYTQLTSKLDQLLDKPHTNTV